MLVLPTTKSAEATTRKNTHTKKTKNKTQNFRPTFVCEQSWRGCPGSPSFPTHRHLKKSSNIPPWRDKVPWTHTIASPQEFLHGGGGGLRQEAGEVRGGGGGQGRRLSTTSQRGASQTSLSDEQKKTSPIRANTTSP